MKTVRERLDSRLLKRLNKEGFQEMLEPIRKRLNRLMGKEKVEKPKKESPLWQAAFKMSKEEVREVVAEDFRQYMMSAHFDIARVRKQLQE